MVQRITVIRLALGIGLAVWLCGAYWMYATRIYPRIHGAPEMSGAVILESLPYPIAFRWGSDEPLVGPSISGLRARFSALHSLDQVGIVEGIYYLDEAETHEDRLALARRRIRNTLKLLPVPDERILTVALKDEVRADVRTQPFEAVRLRLIDLSALLNAGDNTLEVCFPVWDEAALPAIMAERIRKWSDAQVDSHHRRMVITGFVDTPARTDLASARAITVADALVKSGWGRDRIEIVSGEFDPGDPSRGPCVMLRTE